MRASARIAFFVLLGGVINMTMSLMNKAIAKSYSFPVSVVLFQNVSALLCTVGMSSLRSSSLRRPTLSHIVIAAPGSFLFAVALIFAFLALRDASMPVYTSAGSVRPILTLFLEYTVQRAPLTRVKLRSVAVICLGGLVTAWSISGIELVGMGLACLYALLISLVSVFDRRTSTLLAGQQTPMGLNMYRLILSTPILLGMIVTTETDLLSQLPSGRTLTLILVSGAVCLVGGVAQFHSQGLVSATTVQTANVGFKLATVLVSVVMFDEWPTLSLWIGYLLTLIGLVDYTF